MADSSFFSFTPLIGLENFVYFDDGGVNKPGLIDVDHGGTYLPIATSGDPSAVSDPEGRPGSLKTAVQLIGTQVANVTTEQHIQLVINVPPGAPGRVPSYLTAAQLPANGVWDPSKLSPLCLLTPTYSMYGEDEGEVSFVPVSDVCWPVGIAYTMGVVRYIPYQLYSASPALNNAVSSTLGAYGVMVVDVCLLNPDAVTLAQGSVMQAVVDFSWTAGN